MPRSSFWVTNLVIPNAAQASNELNGSDLRDADSITIFAPGTLPEAVRVQIAHVGSPVAADWRDLDQGSGDIVIAAGQAISIDFTAFSKLRLFAAAAVAAERVFNVNKAVSFR